VDLDALAGGEGDLVLCREVARVHQRHVEPAHLHPERHGAQAAGELFRDQPQHFLGNAAQILDRHGGNAELLGETLEQEILLQGVHLQQASADPPTGHVLSLQGAGQLLDGDPAARHQELSELSHRRSRLLSRSGPPFSLALASAPARF
jgi:hypothetical protein